MITSKIGSFILPGIFIAGMLSGYQGQAQVKINVSVNIGSQPQWGPVGYDHVDYYYMPDIDVFYYVPRRQFVYQEGGRWIFAASLPGRCRDYDIYRGYKVVVNESAPYRRCEIYRARYGRYKGCYGQQVVIRDHPHRAGHEDRYDHPGRHGRGHGNGHYRHDNGRWRN